MMFKRGQEVQVDFDDVTPDGSYHGLGIFESFVTKDTPNYERYAGDHAMIEVGESKCCFPLSSIKALPERKPG
jgi:hypothetical protein